MSSIDAVIIGYNPREINSHFQEEINNLRSSIKRVILRCVVCQDERQINRANGMPVNLSNLARHHWCHGNADAKVADRSSSFNAKTDQLARGRPQS